MAGGLPRRWGGVGTAAVRTSRSRMVSSRCASCGWPQASQSAAGGVQVQPRRLQDGQWWRQRSQLGACTWRSTPWPHSPWIAARVPSTAPLRATRPPPRAHLCAWVREPAERLAAELDGVGARARLVAAGGCVRGHGLAQQVAGGEAVVVALQALIGLAGRGPLPGGSQGASAGAQARGSRRPESSAGRRVFFDRAVC